MSGLVSKYKSWDDFHKNMFLLGIVTLVGALISVAFIFLDNIGVLLGWLLGSAVNFFAYVTMHVGSKRLLTPGADPKSGYFTLLWAVLRLALYAGALLLSGFCTFKWGTLAHGYCNLIAVALALMPTWIMLVVTGLIRAPKLNAPKAEQPDAEEPKDEKAKGEGE